MRTRHWLPRPILHATVALSLLAGASLRMSIGAQELPRVACPRCGWIPPTTRFVVRVKSVEELYRAVAGARPDTTILLADGEYLLSRMLDVPTPSIVIRGASGDPAKVMLRGAGITEQQVGVALSISASDTTIADLTVGFVGYHGIQVRGERNASRVMIHNVHVLDTGQQLVKGSTDGGPLHSDDGVVACSILEYRDHAPSDYTNGVDVLGAKGWTVRDNTFRRIRGPAERRWAAGPAILFWANSQLTRVERNTIVDSYRGIALGLGPGASGALARDGEKTYDHQGGWVRNNLMVNLNGWADEGIEANAAGGVSIDHNTVMTGGLPWSISLRFPVTTGFVRNNLTSRSVALRDGGKAERAGNVSDALNSWFVNIVNGDARLISSTVPAIDAGVPIPDLREDMGRQPRVSGSAPDAGAFEYARTPR